jgi:hypothetical protein
MWQRPDNVAHKRLTAGLHSTGSELDRKYWMALGLYAVLAAVAWFTMDAGSMVVMGKPVEMRLLPLIVIGGMALRTVLARQADRIRRSAEKDGNSAS